MINDKYGKSRDIDKRTLYYNNGSFHKESKQPFTFDEGNFFLYLK